MPLGWKAQMILSDENGYVLCLVQAMIGAVSPNLRRAALEVLGPRSVRLCFVLENESPEDREEIEDIAFEFMALQSHEIDMVVDVMVDPRSLDQIDVPSRVVFGRKEASQQCLDDSSDCEARE